MARRSHIMRSGFIGVQAKEEEHDAPAKLEVVHRRRIAEEFHHGTHAEGGQDGIEQITHHSPKTRDETIPTTLVQCPANSQHTHRAHRRTRDDAHNQSFDHKDHRIYRVQKHIRLQISRFFSTYDTFFGKK